MNVTITPQPRETTSEYKPGTLYIDGDDYVFCVSDVGENSPIFLGFIGYGSDSYRPWIVDKSDITLPVRVYTGTVTLKN